MFSLIFQGLSVLGAVAALRWAFGGPRDQGPVVDPVFERLRSRDLPINRAGVEGAASDLYCNPERRACPYCDVLLLGAHDCPKRPLDAFDEAFERSRGKLATVRPIRRSA